jgi:RNA polymerase sigma factor (sigma-70 family)
MLDGSYEQRFLEALPWVEDVLRVVSRRNWLSPAEAEEFASRVKLRLIEDDYRILRVFEGRSHFRTYVTTVVTRLLLDERVREWGKWRPSSEARRLGALAMSLERLITRDNRPLDEAIGVLCSCDPSLSESTLRRIADQLPVRVPARRRVDSAELAALPTPEPGSDHLVLSDEARVRWNAARAALSEVLGSLSARDRLLIKLRYVQGSRVSEIARIVHEEQKPLYRHYEHLLGALRRELALRGVSRQILAEMFVDELRDGQSVGRTAPVSVKHDDDDTRPTLVGR